MNYYFPTESQLQDWAIEWAKKIEPPFIIFLSGELGSGKTTFCRAFIRNFFVTDLIKSPTYSLIEEYKISEHKNIYHIDLYRIQDPEEIYFLALDNYINQSSILLIEWPERALNFLPKADLQLYFSHQEQGRLVEVKL